MIPLPHKRVLFAFVQRICAPMTPSLTQRAAHRIVFANEKGGTGKSTSAVHVGVALSYLGARVTMLDLDPRQRTTFRYLENRVITMQKRGIDLPTPAAEVFKGDSTDKLLKVLDSCLASI